MDLLENVQSVMQGAVNAFGCVPPSGLLERANADMRTRALWLMEFDRLKDEDVSQHAKRFMEGDVDPAITDEASFLLTCRLMSSIEMIDEMIAVGLNPALNRIVKESPKTFLYGLLVHSWPTRREAWWLRFLARLDTGQLWVNPERHPGE